MRKPLKKPAVAAEAVAACGEARVKIADLKAHLSEHLRKVRAGGSLTILDRETPIARIEPYRSARPRLVIHPPTGTWAAFERSQAKVKPLKIDPVAILQELKKEKDWRRT